MPAAENASKKSPPLRWNVSGSYEITSRNDAGLDVGDSSRRLDHRWMEGCRLSQPTLEDNSKARFIKCEHSLAAVSNPEKTDQRCAT